jgi:hypothetical protein
MNDTTGTTRPSKAMKAIAGVLLVVLAAGFLTWYTVSRSRSKRFQAWAREQADAMQPKDIPTNNIVFGIQIVSSDDFRLQVARALLLLKLGDAETFVRVTNSVGIVREGSRTVAVFTNRPPLIMMSASTAFYSLTWCVAGLAHETCHIELAKKRGSNQLIIDSTSVRIRGYRDFQHEELVCAAFELQALEKLGAPRHELDHIRKQDGTHFDVNRDGRWDADDVQLSPQPEK